MQHCFVSIKIFLCFSPDLYIYFKNTLLFHFTLTCFCQLFFSCLNFPACKYRTQCYLILLQFYIFKQLLDRLGPVLSPFPTEAMLFCDHPEPSGPSSCFKRSALYNPISAQPDPSFQLLPEEASSFCLHHSDRTEPHLNTCRMRWKLHEGV